VWRSPSPLGRVGPALGERWSSDGRWILFQTDPFRSASIAADGLPLWAVPTTGGRPIEVEHRLLTAADFVQPCGRSGRMVISAGFDRYVSAHKRIDLAKPPRWRAQSISHETRHSWYAAACSPDGRLVAATVTGNRDEGRFDTAKRSIWLLTSDGSSRKLLVRSGAGISVEQPRWSRDGRWILYLQHRARPNPVAALYLRNVESGQRRGPFGRIKGGLGYYGYHDWDDEAAWYRGP
jgi:Tol biopolymer transport system component